MAMIDNFIDAFDEYVEPRVGRTKNFHELLDNTHKEMTESFRKGDIYKAHTFSADDQKEIKAYIEDMKKQGPKAYMGTQAPPTPKKPANGPKANTMNKKWFVPLSEKGDLFMDRPIPIDAYHIDEKTGSKFGFDSKSKTPSFAQMEHLEELTDKNVTKWFGKEHLPPELQKQYSHLYTTTSKPSIRDNKVEHNKEVVQEKVVSDSTKTKTAPPTPPKSPTVPDELPKVKTDVPDLKKGSNFLKENRGKIALGALGVGLAKSVIDKEDDDVLSSTGKAIKTGLVATGMAVAGEHLMKTETLQDVVRGEVIDNAKKVKSEADLGARNLRNGARLKMAGKIGLIAVGAATVLDVGQKTKEHFDSEKIKREQEFEMAKRRKHAKDKQREMAYGSMRDGEIVFEMFNARTGHHKMGNAKFN